MNRILIVLYGMPSFKSSTRYVYVVHMKHMKTDFWLKSSDMNTAISRITDTF